MRKSIPAKLRELVISRANALYEYCKYLEEDAFYAFHIDHIISLKHGGQDDPENLSYSCPPCNRAKGSDIGTLIGDNKVLIRLFNPREDTWEDHFSWDGVEIVPLTDVAIATIQLLKMNHVDRLIERQRIIRFKK